LAQAFAGLLAKGQARGLVTADDVAAVLHSVELTPEVIDAVIGAVKAEGIAFEADDVALAHHESSEHEVPAKAATTTTTTTTTTTKVSLPHRPPSKGTVPARVRRPRVVDHDDRDDGRRNGT